MAVSVRKSLGPFPRHPTLHSISTLFFTLLHLLRITISFLLLPIDNTVLLASVLVGHLPFPALSANHRRRRTVLRNVHFYPKTILITGIDTPHGLALARAWYYEGHRVVGADVTHLPIRSGESMSRALTAFYHIPKLQYVSRLLDVIHREKVDIWIPCSERATVMENAMAKQVIESRTECRCIHLDTELANQFCTPELFAQYLAEKDLPVVENHQVQSRDSVHRILHRSPTKTYRMRRANSGSNDARVVELPKRTMSMTYSEVSEININKDTPWILQQQSRLGEFVSEMLVVQGHLKSIKVRPVEKQPAWGGSRLDEALATAIYRLMERFATKGGSRLTGHFSIQLMVDEEFDAHSVRHVVHIGGCKQGASAVKDLLHDPSSTIANGYLGILPTHTNNGTADSNEAAPIAKGIMSITPRDGFSLYKMIRDFIIRFLPPLHPVVKQVDRVIFEISQLLFWEDRRFSCLDPMPWWWHAHVYQPLKQVGLILNRRDASRG